MKKPLLLAVLVLACASAPAQAALTLCNRTSYILYAATAAFQASQGTAQGWTRIIPGDCQVARKEKLGTQTYLVHARTSLAHSGPPRAWGGAYPVCVKDGNFTSKQAVMQASCTAEDNFSLPFAPVDNRGKPDWTMNFDEQPAFASQTEAQLAGVRRLLKDNGYKIDILNGKPDKQTGAALAAFRARMQFKPEAGNDDLFAALENQARKSAVPTGYTVCNDTSDILLVALGRIAGDKASSQGWWTVQAGACAKTITTPLTNEALFLLAQKKNGVTLVGGGQSFCTAAAAFQIQGAQSCSSRGLTQAGFAATPTKGAVGYAAHVGPGGLKAQAGMLK